MKRLRKNLQNQIAVLQAQIVELQSLNDQTVTAFTIELEGTNQQLAESRAAHDVLHNTLANSRALVDDLNLQVETSARETEDLRDDLAHAGGAIYTLEAQITRSDASNARLVERNIDLQTRYTEALVHEERTRAEKDAELARLQQQRESDLKLAEEERMQMEQKLQARSAELNVAMRKVDRYHEIFNMGAQDAAEYGGRLHTLLDPPHAT